MSDICYVEELILARVSDPDTGLNPMILQFAQEFGLDQPSKYTIDFTGASAQVLQGEVDADSIDKTSATKYPQFHYWTKSAIDRQENKGGEFSGDIVVQIRLLFTFPQGNALKVNYGKVSRVFIAAMGSTFNRQVHRGWSSPAIALAFSFVRTPVSLGGEYWRQGMLYTMPFIVDV